jgi:hypothetical protein
MLTAQSTVNKVYVLCNGQYDYSTQTQIIPVTLGCWDVNSRTYSVLDTLWGPRFATSIVSNETTIWVAADNNILRYDKTTGNLTATSGSPGVRRLALIGPYLVSTSGGNGVRLYSNVQFYWSDDFTWAGQLDTIYGPTTACEGIAVVGTDIYLVENNGFEKGNEVGKLWRIDMLVLWPNAVYDLGPNAENPQDLFYVGSKLYSVNNPNDSSASISEYLPGDTVTSTFNLMSNSICTPSMSYNGNVAYQIAGSTDVTVFNIATHNSSVAFTSTAKHCSMIQDTVTGNIYAGVTDSISFGKIMIYDQQGIPIDSFETSIVPCNIMLSYDTISTGIKTIQSIPKLQLFPNPASSKINIAGYDGISQVEIWNGINLVYSCYTSSIDISSLSAGVYFVRYHNEFIPFLKMQ